jgi:hypothetical protein
MLELERHPRALPRARLDGRSFHHRPKRPTHLPEHGAIRGVQQLVPGRHIARHIMQHILNPRLLRSMASYDVASNISARPCHQRQHLNFEHVGQLLADLVGRALRGAGTPLGIWGCGVHTPTAHLHAGGGRQLRNGLASESRAPCFGGTSSSGAAFLSVWVRVFGEPEPSFMLVGRAVEVAVGRWKNPESPESPREGARASHAPRAPEPSVSAARQRIRLQRARK